MKHIIYFVCEINLTSTNSLIGNILNSIKSDATELEIHFSSSGGSIEHGFVAYNFLRSLPIPIHMHNIGNVESSAVLPFLAADKRTCCEHSRFTLHNLRLIFGNNSEFNQTRLLEYSDSLRFDSERYANIFNERTKLNQSFVNSADNAFDVNLALLTNSFAMSPNEAATTNIITEPPCNITIDKSLPFWLTQNTK